MRLQEYFKNSYISARNEEMHEPHGYHVPGKLYHNRDLPKLIRSEDYIDGVYLDDDPRAQ